LAFYFPVASRGGAFERAADTLHSPWIDTKPLRYFAHTIGTPGRPKGGKDLRLQLRRYSRPAELLAFGLGAPEAGTHPFLNDRALELGEDTKHLKHRLAAWCRRIDPLLVQEEVNAGGMDFREEGDQVLEASAEPIDRPGHHHIKLAPGRRLVKRIKLWALVLALGTRDAVILIDPHDLPTGSLGNVPQLALLVGRGLVESGNSEVEDSALHDFPHSTEKGYHKSVIKKRDFSVRAGTDFSGGYFVHPSFSRER
jgi:hypothetical protein